MLVKLKSRLLIARTLSGSYVRFIRSILLEIYHGLFKDLSLPEKDYETLHRRTSEEGFEFLSKTLPLLGKVTERGIADGRFTCPCSFKKRKGSALPRFLGSLFCQVFDEDGVLRDDASPDAVLSIRQIAYYSYKSDLPRKKRLDDMVLGRFLETEDELRSIEIPDDPLIQVASAMIASIFEGYTADNIVPAHGPGVTANVPISMKWEHRLSPSMPVYGRFGKLFFFNETDALDRLHRYPISNHHSLFHSEENCAKVILVPKDSRGPRLISCEPAENQFIQQGIARYMARTIENFPMTAGQVNFRSQTVNQRASLKASIDGSLATLDLKDASDRNSLQLFNKLFGSVPELRDDILSCRSTHTSVKGVKVPLSKFAPMGSALCFPVMAVSIWVLLKSYAIGVGYTGDILVYGDDVIVDSSFAPGAMKVLERYGFAVNTSKSFVNSQFTESCGMDSFRGFDVTPIKLRRIWDLLSFSGKATKNKYNKSSVFMVKHAQQMELYPTVSELFYSYAEFFLGPLPYGTQDSPFLCRLSQTLKVRPGVRRRFRAFAVVPEIFSETATTPWGHFYREWSKIHHESSSNLEYSEYNLPRRWNLQLRTYSHAKLMAWGQ